jgi:hypothetical protein
MNMWQVIFKCYLIKINVYFLYFKFIYEIYILSVPPSDEPRGSHLS